jgi:tripartite-type tricarboxylate transporter receptor subunit TctC
MQRPHAGGAVADHAEHPRRQQRRAGKNFAELIALAKAQPGKLSYASPGVRHAAAHRKRNARSARPASTFVHVPYRGAVFTDVIGGAVTNGTMQNVARSCRS